jgi:hypothetical protein
MYTQVDGKLKPISVKLLNSNDMKTGNIHQGFLRGYWTQLGKNANIKDLKTRLLDHINAGGH